jgi:hypothetical protein
MSSVSGGSWFTTQYTFSKKFFDGVNQQTPTDFYTQWLEDYYKMLTAKAAESQGLSFTSGVNQLLSYMGQMGQQAAGYLTGANVADYDWEKFISFMIDEYTPGLSQQTAEPSNRFGQPYADLLVCTTMPTGGVAMSGTNALGISDGNHNKVYYNGAPTPDTIIPMAWHVPGAHRGGASSWFSPQYALSTLTVTMKVDSSENCWGMCGSDATHTASVETQALTQPTVGKAAAMSSAAVGILGTTADGMLGAAAASISAKNGIPGLKDLANMPTGLEGMAVCSGPFSMRNTECKFPSVRFLDGGYSDDSAIALTIAKMQQELGTEVTMRLAALDSDECSPNKTAVSPWPGMSCGLKYDWGDLFAGAFAPDAEAYLHGGAYGQGAKIPTITNRIFAHDISDAHLPGKRFSEVLHDAANPAYNMTVSTGTFTTADNKPYGIKGGQTVKVMVLHINSLLSTELVNQGAAETAKYAQLAQSTYDILHNHQVLAKFYNN